MQMSLVPAPGTKTVWRFQLIANLLANGNSERSMARWRGQRREWLQVQLPRHIAWLKLVLE